MQAMRDLLRTTLGRSLNALSPLDRLAAAWPVAAGHAIAERSHVSHLEGTVVTIAVQDAGWQRQLASTDGQLRSELARIARVPLTDILFLLPAGAAPTRANATHSRRKPA